tara:strand:- start:487 stop:681 length:195 start_codon:yes stop_codon:yes gene_type:complete
MMSDTMPVVIQEDKKTWVDKIQSLDGFGIIVLPFILLEAFIKDIMGVTENKVSQGHKRKDMDAL